MSGGTVGKPERRVAWVEGERELGSGRWREAGMEMKREVAEQGRRNATSKSTESVNMVEDDVEGYSTNVRERSTEKIQEQLSSYLTGIV